jgi:hypothetical protein
MPVRPIPYIRFWFPSVLLIQNGGYGSHLEFGFSRITPEHFHGLSEICFVDWAQDGWFQ